MASIIAAFDIVAEDEMGNAVTVEPEYTGGTFSFKS
jgi:hypothetical protein